MSQSPEDGYLLQRLDSMVLEKPITLGLIEYVQLVNDEILAEIGRLRIAAWEAYGPRPSFAPESGESWLDPHDMHAHHWIIRQEEKIVASARMCIHATLDAMPDSECLVGLGERISLPAASLNRLVVHPDCRGSHCGPAFDRVRILCAQKLGAKGVFGTTQPKSRLLDLQSAGFEVLTESQHRIVPHLPSFVLWKAFGPEDGSH